MDPNVAPGHYAKSGGANKTFRLSADHLMDEYLAVCGFVLFSETIDAS